MDSLNMEYEGSDVSGRTFTLTNNDDELEIEVTNEHSYPNGFHSLDAKNNMMKIYVEGE